jgi:putative FmdB family regulatory protein
MPIYEYECTKCGHQIEAWQKFSDPPLTECEHCHGKMKKLISQSTFHLKGSGWYVTDYASKRGGNQTHSPKAENKDSSKTSKDSPDSYKSSKVKDSPSKVSSKKSEKKDS